MRLEGNVFKKPEKWREKRYTDWVKTLTCVSCQVMPADDPHHINVRGLGKGMATKVSDCFCIPLCRLCHSCLTMTAEEQMLEALRTIERALNEGILEWTAKNVKK